MSDKVRVAIIGVGNCASSFIQGVHFYRNAKADEFVPGLMHVNLGGYHISDIEFTCAFDIDKTRSCVVLASSRAAAVPRAAARRMRACAAGSSPS